MTTQSTPTFIPATRENIRSIKEWVTPESNTYKIDFDLIHTDLSFNKRIDYGDLEGLANNILENGLIVPLIGDFGIDPKTNEVFFLLTDGYRRYKALEILIKKRKKDFGTILCRINEKGISMEDRFFKMFVTQDNLKLSDVEVSMVFRELVNLGVKIETISKKVSKSATYVKDMLVLSQQTEVVKEAVQNGKAATTAVIKTAKEVGADATKKAVEETNAKNKKFKVNDADAIIEERKHPQIQYEERFVMPETVEAMEKMRDRLLGLNERTPTQVKNLNKLIDAIKLRHDAIEDPSTQSTPESKFDTKVCTKFCATYAGELGLEKAMEICTWFKTEIEGE